MTVHNRGKADARACVEGFRGMTRRVVGLSSGDVYRAWGVAHGTEPGPPEPLPLIYGRRDGGRGQPYLRQMDEGRCKIVLEQAGAVAVPAGIRRERDPRHRPGSHEQARGRKYLQRRASSHANHRSPEHDIVYHTSHLWRKLGYREVVSSLLPQSGHGIDARGAPGGQAAG